MVVPQPQKGSKTTSPGLEEDLNPPLEHLPSAAFCEALENALAQITAVTFEPKQTLDQVKRRIAKILLAVRDRGQEEQLTMSPHRDDSRLSTRARLH
jgi:hypothetical protein